MNQRFIIFRRPGGRGFTMVEILLAMMILGIGLIMIATVMPVGANWNRQNIEESVAIQIARNAKAIIQTKYTQADLAAVTTTLTAIPSLTSTGRLPLVERAFAYGASPAYPAVNPTGAFYFWTAMIRKSPDPVTRSQNRYDVYIFVMKKGSVEQTFTTGTLGRDTGDGTGVPGLESNTLATATASDFVVGSQGVGVTSGTVFRLLATGQTTTALAGTENVIYAPPADGASVSPLIYIYQTSVAF